MKYGKFLEKGKTIGVVAPSFGCSGYPYLDKYKSAKEKLTNLGYKINETKHLYELHIDNLLKENHLVKAKEFVKSYIENDIIWPVAGGEIEVKTIENIDFDEIKNAEPKFVIGFSDNTWLDFILTTKLDIATIYGYHIPTLGMNNYHDSCIKLLDLVSGKDITFESYDKYEIIDTSKEEGKALDGFNLTEDACWKSLNKKEHSFKGRIIGGCLDILINIIGSKYDYMNEFINRYQKDGTILYFEACDLNIIDQFRAISHILNSDWINNCNGILIGRPIHKETIMGIEYESMLKELFKDINIPVIYDVDIGHLPPQIPVVNGSIAEVNFKNKKGTIKFNLVP